MPPLVALLACADWFAAPFNQGVERCDGSADEAGARVWRYEDQDRDGFGADGSGSWVTCGRGGALFAGDCDDFDADAWPGAPELPGAPDLNCDGETTPAIYPPDEKEAWYLDEDRDGYGSEEQVFLPGPASGKVVRESGDCDDTDPSVHPGADEYCSGGDHDCDGLAQEGSSLDAVSGYLDLDGDGYGRVLIEPTCVVSGALVDVDGDCDDEDTTTHPGAAELCDGLDQDCDHQIDNGAPPTAVGWVDGDFDGFGDPLVPAKFCPSSAGFSFDNTDCDDTDATVWPGAPASCEAKVDMNCDGLADDQDADHDGWITCEDCNDGDPGVHPTAGDACLDGVDADCDGGDGRCTPEGPQMLGASRSGQRMAMTGAIQVTDVDADGRADLVLGIREAWLSGIGNGGVFAWMGPVTTNPDALHADRRWTGGTPCYACGAAFVWGELDGDALPELVIADTARREGARFMGAVRLLNEPESTEVAQLEVFGVARDDEFGATLLGGIDLDDDGVAEIAATAPGAWEIDLIPVDWTGERSAVDAPTRLIAASDSLRYGSALATVDWNGDGVDDLATSSPEGWGGRVYVWEGPVGGVRYTTDADVRISSDNPMFGWALLTTDGGLLVSAVGAGATGEVWLLPSGATSIDEAAWTAEGLAEDDGFGVALAQADNGTLYVGAPWYDNSRGAAFRFDGPLVGSASALEADGALVGTEDQGALGMILATGDLDGDSIPDVVVQEPGARDLGVAWLWSGA